MALGAGDCERLHDGLIAQPVNTASALAAAAGRPAGGWAARQPAVRPRSPLQGHAAWHVLTAAALAAWSQAALDPA